MSYTIKEAAERSGLTASAIRFYDKEGLLPFVKRSDGGYRLFSDMDIALLQIIDSLKSTGMPIKEILRYTRTEREGCGGTAERYRIFTEQKTLLLEQKQSLESQLEVLNARLRLIERKCEHHEKALKDGRECSFFTE